MKRRDFFRASAAVGLTVSTPIMTGNIARAESPFGIYDGPLWVYVNATGGWDPTMIVDPKGKETQINNYFSQADKQPVEGNPVEVAPGNGVPEFFNRYGHKTSVINGIDCQTFNHHPGERFAASGILGAGNPSFAALYAAATAPEAPMAYISDGLGYDFTGGLVTASRTDEDAANYLNELANPNLDIKNNQDYFSPDVLEIIQAARAERLQALNSIQKLPRVQQSMGELYTARIGKGQLKELEAYIGALGNETNPAIAAGKLGLAAYQAGLTRSISLSIKGFDTHADHDNLQGQRIQMLLNTVDAILSNAEEQGLADQVVVVVNSEFGRTPGYNGAMGKDHHTFSSMFIIGDGIPAQVLGATTDQQAILKVKPGTFEVVGDNDAGGVRINQGHVNAGMRKLAKIDGHEYAQAFNLGVSDMGLFG